MRRTRCGQSIIEILLAMAFSLVMLPGLFGAFYVSRQGKPQHLARIRAVTLSQELTEIVRSIREIGWDQFSAYAINTPYHPVQSGNIWTLDTGTDQTAGFTRSIMFQRVYRDGSGAIVDSGGTEDLSSRRVDVSVSWLLPLPASVSYASYITRHDNMLVIDTTEADFTNGDTISTAVRNNIDGEVVLGATGGEGDWCQPSLSIAALDLPKSGVANAISAIQGQIAAGTGDNASGVSYANILVSDPTSPTSPTASVSGTFDGYKTNGVFTEQDYAYLATDTNSKEVVIVNLQSQDSSGKYQQAGYFDAPGNGNATAVATAGQIGYMVGGTKLYNFDLQTKTDARPRLDDDGLSLPATANHLVVIGTRAFITTDSSTAQLVILDLSNSANLIKETEISLPGASGVALYVNSSGTRAYVATHTSTTQRELFIVNTEISSPGYRSVLGSYDTSGMNPKGVTVVSGPRAIIAGIGAEEYQVVDITNESTNPLPRCGGIQINTGVNGVSSVFTAVQRAYSYIITGEASSELKIIEGGPGAGGNSYVLNGTFTSQVFDAQAIATGSSQAAFNRFTANISRPSSVTDIALQVAAADTGSDCAAASFSYVGPDGTSATAYTTTDDVTIAGAIPFSNDSAGFENPARCFRYQAAMSTTDSTLTPQLLDFTLSLSP